MQDIFWVTDRTKWYWTKWYGQNCSNFYRF